MEERPHLPLRHLIFGLIIRELLAPWTGHPYDFEIWARLGFYMQSLDSPYRTLFAAPGVSFSPFPTTGSIGYPPLSAFAFALTYRVYALMGEPSRFVYYFLLKQPMVFADIGIAIVLAKIILFSGDVRLARTGLLVWVYFPLGIIISSVWGQLDPISLFLTLVAVYYFLSSKWLASASMLGLSIYLKALPIVFLPIFMIQSGVSRRKRVGHLLVALTIPLAGTVIPAIAFNWNLQGIYRYFVFQTALPGTGEMSVLGAFYSIPALWQFAQYFTPFLWIPVLLGAYTYVRRTSFGLLPGLLIAILAFTISRPFLSEQYTIYPLAFLLLMRNRENTGHFVGLATASTAFLVANNTLLVTFFSPLFPWAFNWNEFPWTIFTINQPPQEAIRATVMSLSAVLYFAESLLVILRRESFVYRAALFAKFLWPTHNTAISLTGGKS